MKGFASDVENGAKMRWNTNLESLAPISNCASNSCANVDDQKQPMTTSRLPRQQIDTSRKESHYQNLEVIDPRRYVVHFPSPFCRSKIGGRS